MEKLLMAMLVKSVKESMTRRDGGTTSDLEVQFVIADSLTEEEQKKISEHVNEMCKIAHGAVLRNFEERAPENIVDNSDSNA